MLGKPTILCLGDSHTYGVLGASWVRSLETALPKLHFINTGVNGTQTKNVHMKLGKLIGGLTDKTLVGVTLLIGTNDCMRSLACEANDYLGLQNYRCINGDTGPATAATFEHGYSALLNDLAGQLRKAAAAASRQITLFVTTLPPIGEVLDDEANKRVDEYNTIIRTATSELQKKQQMLDAGAGAAGGAGAGGLLQILLIDLSARCKAAIQGAFSDSTTQQSTKAASEGKGDATSAGTATGGKAAVAAPRGLPTPFWRTAVGTITCALRRYIWGISFDRQSALGGTVLLHDGIHLNETGARLLEGLLEPYMRPLEAAAGGH